MGVCNNQTSSRIESAMGAYLEELYVFRRNPEGLDLFLRLMN